METYRLYFMRPSDGHITHYKDFEAADDLEALGMAAELEGTGPIELWCGRRKVDRFEAASDPKPIDGDGGSRP